MKIIAITGGVAAGKNLVAKIFEKYGAEIFDADDEVHKILNFDTPTIDQISKIFPESLIDDKISRSILGKIVFTDKQKLKILENIIHPKIQQKYQEFILSNQAKNQEIVVLNIPLLLENNQSSNQSQSPSYNFDYLIALRCAKEIRKQRFIKRFIENSFLIPNSDLESKKIEKRFDEIVKLQISDEMRFSKADFIIDNSKDIQHTEMQIKEFFNKFNIAKIS